MVGEKEEKKYSNDNGSTYTWSTVSDAKAAADKVKQRNYSEYTDRKSNGDGNGKTGLVHLSYTCMRNGSAFYLSRCPEGVAYQ